MRFAYRYLIDRGIKSALRIHGVARPLESATPGAPQQRGCGPNSAHRRKRGAGPVRARGSDRGCLAETHPRAPGRRRTCRTVIRNRYGRLADRTMRGW